MSFNSFGISFGGEAGPSYSQPPPFDSPPLPHPPNNDDNEESGEDNEDNE
jgi:hypothetical protein